MQDGARNPSPAGGCFAGDTRVRRFYIRDDGGLPWWRLSCSLACSSQ